MQLQAPSSPSIFDLAKVAQARTQSIDEGYFSAKKPIQHFQIMPIGSYESSSSSASDVSDTEEPYFSDVNEEFHGDEELSLIHISEPTRPY